MRNGFIFTRKHPKFVTEFKSFFYWGFLFKLYRFAFKFVKVLRLLHYLYLNDFGLRNIHCILRIERSVIIIKQFDFYRKINSLQLYFL